MKAVGCVDHLLWRQVTQADDLERDGMPVVDGIQRFVDAAKAASSPAWDEAIAPTKQRDV